LATESKHLEAHGKLPPTLWLRAPETLAVINALTAEGTEVRFVGGCVRDALRYKLPDDIDLATLDRPTQVIKLLTQAGIRAIPTGIDHGTVTAVVDEKSFEITTLRIDLKTDGRRAVIGFTDNWVIDAKRRDFTFNALSASIDGDIYDPTSGLWDLAHGQVRFIGNAHDRIAEDYLRILRYFRFYGALGRPPIDSEALAAIRHYAKNLYDLSGERIRNELFKILCVPDPAEILIKMRSSDVLDKILPEAGDPGVLRLVNWFGTRAINIDGINPDPIRHLAALICSNVRNTDELAQRLSLSSKDHARLKVLCAPPIKILPDMGTLSENKALRKYGLDLFRDLALLAWANEMHRHRLLPIERKQSWVAMLEQTASWAPPTFPLRGEDVKALGIEPGPQIGRLLARVEDWWESHGYLANRQQCLDQLFKEANR
jgi:poly(A) polymerase